MTIVINDELKLFSEHLKGSSFLVDRSALRDECLVASLSKNEILDLEKSGFLTPSGVGAATIVPERGHKPGNVIAFEEHPINVFKAISQLRFPIEATWTQSGREGIVATFLEKAHDTIATGIDTAVIHGTQPGDGTNLIAGNDYTIYTSLTQNAQTQPLAGETPADVAQALWQARGAVRRTRKGDVNGYLFDDEAFYDLPQFGDGSVETALPGFVSENANFRGTPVYLTDKVGYNYDIGRIGATGQETGIVSIAGDFDKIRIGIEPIEIGTFKTGNPDGLVGPEGESGDLQYRNEALVRVEYRVQFLIEQPEAFVKVVSAEETD